MQRQSCCCLTFFQPHDSALDTTLIEENFEFDYGENRSSRIPTRYDLKTGKYFHEFLDKNIEISFQGGWKIHIAIDPNQIVNAFHNIILPIFLKYEIKNFKIIRQDQLDVIRNEGENQGKAITIYLVHNPEFQVGQLRHEAFQEMLIAIDRGLRCRWITPGNRAPIDEHIAGSSYFSYRCDAGERHGPDGVTFWPMLANEASQLAQQNGTPAHNPAEHEDAYGLSDFNLAPTVSCAIM